MEERTGVRGLAVRLSSPRCKYAYSHSVVERTFFHSHLYNTASEYVVDTLNNGIPIGAGVTMGEVVNIEMYGERGNVVRSPERDFGGLVAFWFYKIIMMRRTKEDETTLLPQFQPSNVQHLPFQYLRHPA